MLQDHVIGGFESQSTPDVYKRWAAFGKDRNCSYLDKQYMLGVSLLSAPIFHENGTAECVVYQKQKPINSDVTLRFINCMLSSVKGGQIKTDGKDTLVTAEKGKKQIVCEE